jgi:hypothetical protein
MKKFLFTTIAAIARVAGTGCTDTADVFPMNAAAKQLGPLRIVHQNRHRSRARRYHGADRKTGVARITTTPSASSNFLIAVA